MATEPKKKPRGIRGGVYTEDSGLPPPQDIDGASVTPGPKKTFTPTPKGFRRAGDSDLEVPGKNVETYYDAKDRYMYRDPDSGAMKPAFDTRSKEAGAKAGAGRGVVNPPVPKDAMYAKGGSVGSASRRADGIAQRGKTKGRMM
jgi:hypothetical protein